MTEKKKQYHTQPVHSYDPFDALDWDEDDLFPEISSVASACECTGMMPRPPVNEGEDEAYRGLFSGEIPKDK